MAEYNPYKNWIDELYDSAWDPHSKVQEIRKILNGMNMNGTASYGLKDQNNINIINAMRNNSGEGRGSEEWLNEMLNYAKQLKPENNSNPYANEVRQLTENWIRSQNLDTVTRTESGKGMINDGGSVVGQIPDFQKQVEEKHAAENGTSGGQASGQAGQTAPAATTAEAVENATQGANNIGTNPAMGYQGYEKPENKGLFSGVSDETKKMLEKYQAGYEQSDIVTAAQERLAEIQNAKPQGYESKYGEQLDALLQQIMNPEKFNYEFNGDNLFKAYADLYEQQAQQANLNAQGAAAAMTGGYGNSYAESVGNEAYQQQMTQLYDKGQQFRDTAYQAYQDELAQRQNQYNILNAAEQAEYGQYRDLYEDWAKQEELAYNREFNERQMDYNRYIDQLNYYTGLAQIENQAYTSEEARQEAIRQFTLSYNESIRQYEKSFDEQARQFDLNLQLGYDTLTSNENIAAGHDAASIASSQISADASMYAARLNAEGNEKELALREKELEEKIKQFERTQSAAESETQWQHERAEGQDAQKQADQIRSEARSLVMATIQAKRWPTPETIQAAGMTEKDVEQLLGFPRGGSPAGAGGAGGGARTVFRTPSGALYALEGGKYVPTTAKPSDRIVAAPAGLNIGEGISSLAQTGLSALERFLAGK